MLERIAATPEAVRLIEELRRENGPLLFHQSGGCCDGSAPMCYPAREFRVGQRDVLLGEVAGTPVYIGAQQFELWEHTHLTLDVVPGRGGGFSLEVPKGVRFLTRSRVFSDEEYARLKKEAPLHRGPPE
jgi:uncharacterized protein